MDSPRLFVRNLAFHITEPDLRELFSTYGEIESVSPSVRLASSYNET